MGNRINTVMQVCFFALAGVMPRDEAIAAIKKAIRKTYGKKGEEVVAMNMKAVDSTLENLFEIPVGPAEGDATSHQWVPDNAPPFVRDVAGQKSWPGKGTTSPLAPCPPTAPSPMAPLSTKSATSATKCPLGTPMSASSAASASWSAPMR